MKMEEVDVLICGSGSAGICAATYLAKCGLRCKVLESKPGPLELGQADGVQCRTVEIFESFGLAEDLLREAYHVLEVTFWSPSADSKGGIIRKGRTADTQPGLSHQPHVILNQARVNGIMLGAMKKYNNQEVDYGFSVKSVEVDESATHDPEAHCVKVVAQKNGIDHIFKAKYALGCDGAHSAVRRSLGYKMVGDSSDSVWGVMDIYPLTNFPDVRKKVVIKSDAGSMLIVPREGDELARFYIELPAGTIAKDIKFEDLLKSAQQIFSPYTLEAAGTVWWSAYSIGQRVADNFTKCDRVFLTGDACHTHSPKAGQGMNTSLQDGFNLGWKLAAVLKKQAHPDLLKTYATERGKVAHDLINFDREFAKSFSSRTKSPDGSADSFTNHFIKSGVYTAGLSARYVDTIITGSAQSRESYATKLTVGMRFPSTQVVRLSDARAVQMARSVPSDGRWRILIFPGDILQPAASERLRKIGEYLNSEEGPVRKHTPSTSDIDSIIESIVVLSGERTKIEQDQIPDYFWPKRGKWGMRDLHKIYIDDESYNSGHGHAYDFYGVDPSKGALVIVRPDQYISMVLAVEDSELLGGFFNQFLTDASV